MDVIELDGASNRGIDEIRAIRDNVRFAPANSKYKIYIIDEAHQITQDAFNALLKTLEEPPAHIIFMMATTELNEFPTTILSRSQKFTFRPISVDQVAGQLKNVLQQENLPVDESVIRLLA
jgi:DNA polymerase-3 subunit gamma/tau